jgi:hypothetical protein
VVLSGDAVVYPADAVVYPAIGASGIHSRSPQTAPGHEFALPRLTRTISRRRTPIPDPFQDCPRLTFRLPHLFRVRPHPYFVAPHPYFAAPHPDSSHRIAPSPERIRF